MDHIKRFPEYSCVATNCKKNPPFYKPDPSFKCIGCSYLRTD